jgi:hypothetical protein
MRLSLISALILAYVVIAASWICQVELVSLY